MARDRAATVAISPGASFGGKAAARRSAAGVCAAASIGACSVTTAGCRFCHAVSRLNKNGFCRKCGPIFRVSMTEMRRRHRVLRRFVGPPTFRQHCLQLRRITQNAVKRAVTAGTLPNLRLQVIACRDCGQRATVLEHRDYTRPMDVEPTCGPCNQRRGIGYPHPRIPLDDLVPKSSDRVA